LFLIICAVYVLTLAIAALVAARLYQPPDASLPPPGLIHPQQVPPPPDWSPPGP
jgi:hypothetical protein